MTINRTTFGNLYLFIKRNSQTTKANSFQLVDEFCETHNLDTVTLKELFFYFGASNDKEVLVKVKGHVIGKASLRQRGYNLNKMARS